MNLEQIKLTNPQGQGWPFESTVPNSAYNQLLGEVLLMLVHLIIFRGKQKSERSENATAHTRGRCKPF
jgi:hypothetical protein